MRSYAVSFALDVAYSVIIFGLLFTLACPTFAQSPFAGGATQLPAQILQILTPIAVVGVMGAFLGALFAKISWGWFVGIIIGVVGIFGSQQIVTWIRGMFGV